MLSRHCGRACFTRALDRARFTTFQDARRVRLVDGLDNNIWNKYLIQIFYEYHPLKPQYIWLWSAMRYCVTALLCRASNNASRNDRWDAPLSCEGLTLWIKSGLTPCIRVNLIPGRSNYMFNVLVSIWLVCSVALTKALSLAVARVMQ